MNESFLAKTLRWLVYASAFVPLIIFSQFISPFHFGKVVVLRSIVQVMAVLYLLLIWRDASYRPKGHPLLWTFLSFALAFTLTSLTSVAFLQSFWGTLERMGGLFTFWHYFIFYVIAVSVLRTRQDWQTLLNIMVGVGVASAIYGFLQKTDWSFILGSGGRSRPFGTIGNAALFAGYQILVAFLAFTLSAMKRTTPAMRNWYLVAGGTTLLAALSTAVRGSLIGIVVGGLLWALLWSAVNRSKRAKNFLLAGLVALILFVFLGVTLRSTDFIQRSSYLNRITDFSANTFTVKTRFWAWEAGFKGWSESAKTMLVGWGPENFNVPFSKHFNPKFFTAPGAETFFDRAHNMFVEVVVTMGLLGFLTYLSLFVVSFKTYAGFIRQGGDARVLGIGFSAMTVAYAIHNSFIFDTSANFLTFFMLLAFVTHVAQRGLDTSLQKPIQGARRVPWTGAQITAASVLTVIVLVTIYSTNIRPIKANYATTRAIIAGWQGDWVGAVNKYREAIAYDTLTGRYEFRHRFAQYLLELSSTTDVSKVPNFQEVTLSVIEDVKKNAIDNPQDYLPLLYLSRMYIILGKGDPASPYNDMALEMSARALEISPTFVRTYYEVGQTYLNKGDLEKAVEWFQKAAQLNPDVAVTYWYIGSVQYQIASQKGDEAGMKAALANMSIAVEKGHTLSESDGVKLAQIFLQLRDFKSMAAIFEQLVGIAPTKTEYWAQLIATYGELDDRDTVIKTIRRALAIPAVAADEEFTAKAVATLRQLGVQP
jgi:tetratricopeptide (TPR) repeat protein/O-antigen ligase